MAYGDGSFFFTQPVGNGYSGLGSFGVPQLSSPVRGRKATASFAPPAFAAFRGRFPASGSSAAAVSSYCLEPGASCTLAEVEAELARVSAISRGGGVTATRRQTLMGLNSLRDALIAAMAAGTEDTTTMGPVVTDESTDGAYESWNVLPEGDLAAGQAPMDIFVPELPPEGYSQQDVSLDIEPESSGTMGWVGWVQDNMLLSAAIAGTVGFFGYRYYSYAKKQGMI